MKLSAVIISHGRHNVNSFMNNPPVNGDNSGERSGFDEYNA